MNSKSVEKSKLKNAENQARTLNLIIAKMVSNIWKGKEERLQEKIQKFRGTICRCKNILFSRLYRIRKKVRLNKEKINQHIRELKNKKLMKMTIIDCNEIEQMLKMLGTMSEVGGEC